MDPRRACSNPRNDARLFYFAAALPAVGFVHGAADLNPLAEAAPGRFSTTNWWPSRSDSRWHTRRATMSGEKPAPNPTMMRTGRFG